METSTEGVEHFRGHGGENVVGEKTNRKKAQL